MRCDPIQVSQWKRQLLDGASELFTRGKKTKDQEEGQAKEAELFQQIGRLQMELEWLKKSLSCSDASELRKLVDNAHAKLSVSRQCALLGLPRSTLYFRPTPVRDSTLRISAGRGPRSEPCAQGQTAGARWWGECRHHRGQARERMNLQARAGRSRPSRRS